MAIIADSGAVYGLYDRSDTFHNGLRAAIETARERIVLPAPVLGEIDYLLRARLGNPALLRFLEDIQEGAFTVETVTLSDLRRCAALIAKYPNLDLGLSDASVVASRTSRHQSNTYRGPERLSCDTFRTREAVPPPAR